MAAMGMPVPFTRGEKTILTGLSAIREAIEAQKNEPEKVEPEKVYFTLEEAAEYLRLTNRQLKDLCRAAPNVIARKGRTVTARRTGRRRASAVGDAAGRRAVRPRARRARHGPRRGR